MSTRQLRLKNRFLRVGSDAFDNNVQLSGTPSSNKFTENLEFLIEHGVHRYTQDELKFFTGSS